MQIYTLQNINKYIKIMYGTVHTTNGFYNEMTLTKRIATLIYQITKKMRVMK